MPASRSTFTKTRFTKFWLSRGVSPLSLARPHWLSSRAFRDIRACGLRSALPLRPQRVFKYLPVECQVRHHLLQFPILVPQMAQFAGIGRRCFAEVAHPCVARSRACLGVTVGLDHWHSARRLAQRVDDLARSLHENPMERHDEEHNEEDCDCQQNQFRPRSDRTMRWSGRPLPWSAGSPKGDDRRPLTYRFVSRPHSRHVGHSSSRR